ncbi:hypothetical protein GGS23DRAFT_240864 [Durotheca rogersii]|uniref:uncharacterized protein n=1 Tax=Durotheca rogersii TaxID=419775 RepID=UPI00221FC505|nr:uncharacterized protein GGS23DRAFT_240864 [Durotheca rogersii]KAI5860241.1 hypothetical protein GGS23DRAFT_240864 [Durotheca rogersii]
MAGRAAVAATGALEIIETFSSRPVPGRTADTAQARDGAASAMLSTSSGRGGSQSSSSRGRSSRSDGSVKRDRRSGGTRGNSRASGCSGSRPLLRRWQALYSDTWVENPLGEVLGRVTGSLPFPRCHVGMRPSARRTPAPVARGRQAPTSRAIELSSDASSEEQSSEEDSPSSYEGADEESDHPATPVARAVPVRGTRSQTRSRQVASSGGGVAVARASQAAAATTTPTRGSAAGRGRGQGRGRGAPSAYCPCAASIIIIY